MELKFSYKGETVTFTGYSHIEAIRDANAMLKPTGGYWASKKYEPESFYWVHYSGGICHPEGV